MKKNTMHIAAAALACLLLAAAASAAAPDQGWRLRVNGYWIDTSEGRVSPSNTGYRSRVENSAAAGGGVAGEYRFGPRLGIELGLLGGADTDYTVAFDAGAIAVTNTMAFDAACVGLNVHLTPGKQADFYAGPFIAYVTYSDVRVGVPDALPGSTGSLGSVSVDFDEEMAFGANIGVDVPISQRHWIFNAALKYLAASPDTSLEWIGVGTRRESTSIDPLMLGVGFGYRF